ncbi:PQQ-dependent sugar dehydrogenase [Rhodovulum sp. DZ06]|uniref:PQQ-dependent sugar dehydrogenase n=1 Tax=Rhodovulum sp. DZ06 TaxID=3425126 RepID=UPI003D34881E
MTRAALRIAVAAAAAIAAAAAPAQDFNDAAPNAPDQRPAFANQTRAPVLPAGPALSVETLAAGLDEPWGMARLPGGARLVTEKPGRMRLVAPDGTVSAPIAGVPPVDARGQGGLLDVAIRDSFAEDRRVWWSFSEPRAGGNSTSVATGTLSEDGARLSDVRVIFRQEPAWDNGYHFGSRLVFDAEGMLFVTTGERSSHTPRRLAQDVGTHLGKVLRIDPEGGPAPGGPDIPGGLPEIWSYGHRNVQGAAMGPDGALWTVEHGPRGGDELNRPGAGLNHGWPVITYGVEYSGRPVGDGITAAAGMEQPVYYWDPVIAPSGMVFYDGEMFPEWRGDLLIGALRGALVRLELDLSARRVTGEARRLADELGRVRDVSVDPDGAVILLIEDDGALLRLSRAE